jgi:membrane-bound serine protease (ClpP class)
MQAVIVLVFVCGLLAMVVELFIPGMVIGTIGFLAALGSVIYAFVEGYHVLGVVLLVCTIAMIPLFFALWRNVVGRFFAITTDESGFSSSSAAIEDLLGVEGVAMSPLRPSGIARLNDRRYDVVTRGEMLEKGTAIKVIEVSGNRIVVKRV